MNIGIIGCGTIGSGLATCLSKTHSLVLFDTNTSLTHSFKKQCSSTITCAQSVDELIAHSELIILAVKPQHIPFVCRSISKPLSSDSMLVSTAAGVPMDKLKDFFPGASVARIMLNLACFHGQGVISLVESPHLDTKKQQLLENLFKDLGLLIWVPEEHIDALTALTGSGPAFIFVLIEALIDAGISMGLQSKDARDLALQMIIGSTTMMKETKKHPGELKWQVSSPGGVTIAGLQEMEHCAMRSGMIKTVLAAHAHSKKGCS